MGISKALRFEEFRNLDQSPNADFLINSMEVMYSLSVIRSIKKNAIAALSLKDGDTVLEVGCGLGLDAEALAQHVGSTGSVVAIDSSTKMLDEAKSRSENKNVQYLQMSGNKLDFPDNTFDGCYADRLLVSHVDYKDLLQEMIRVLKPGGKICITDVDASSISISPYSKTTKAILEQIKEGFVNIKMGSILADLFLENGLHNIDFIHNISPIHAIEKLQKIFHFPTIINELVDHNRISSIEANFWIPDMQEASKSGDFLYSVSMFTAVGQK